ncbi:unnamed protein product, partial [Phaeothamnion confervicola]
QALEHEKWLALQKREMEALQVQKALAREPRGAKGASANGGVVQRPYDSRRGLCVAFDYVTGLPKKSLTGSTVRKLRLAFGVYVGAKAVTKLSSTPWVEVGAAAKATAEDGKAGLSSATCCIFEVQHVFAVLQANAQARLVAEVQIKPAAAAAGAPKASRGGQSLSDGSVLGWVSLHLFKPERGQPPRLTARVGLVRLPLLSGPMDLSAIAVAVLGSGPSGTSTSGALHLRVVHAQDADAARGFVVDPQTTAMYLPPGWAQQLPAAARMRFALGVGLSAVEFVGRLRAAVRRRRTGSSASCVPPLRRTASQQALQALQAQQRWRSGATPTANTGPVAPAPPTASAASAVITRRSSAAEHQSQAQPSAAEPMGKLIVPTVTEFPGDESKDAESAGDDSSGDDSSDDGGSDTRDYNKTDPQQISPPGTSSQLAAAAAGAKPDTVPAMAGASPDKEAVGAAARRGSLGQQPYKAGDGLDIYVDQATGLPEGCSVSRVSLKAFTRRGKQVGGEALAVSQPGSAAAAPLFCLRHELRADRFEPDTVLLARIDTLDSRTGQLHAVGYAMLPAFAAAGGGGGGARAGAGARPVGVGGAAFFINAGSFQAALHQRPPAEMTDLTAASLAASPRVPCASLLVRLRGAAKAPDGSGANLSSATTPEADWLRLGVVAPPPEPGPGVYNDRALPLKEVEVALLVIRARLGPEVLVWEAAATAQRAAQAAYNAAKAYADPAPWMAWAAAALMGRPGRMLDCRWAVRYAPEHGLTASVAGLVNMPGGGVFTAAPLYKAMHSLLAPGLYYQDPPMTDQASFSRRYDLSSPQSHPRYADAPHTYRHVRPHPAQCLVVDVRVLRFDKGSGAHIVDAPAPPPPP